MNQKTTLTQRLLALLCALAMMFAMMPTAAFAEENPAYTVTITGDDSVTLPDGSTTLTAVVKDSNQDEVSGATVTWSSSDSGVATVNEEGMVTAVARGEATITATYTDSDSNEYTAQQTITVDYAAVTGITLDQPDLTLDLSGTKEETLTATFTPETGYNPSTEIEWTSSDTTKVTVVADATDSTKATVQALANTGDSAVTITAKVSDTIKAECSVTVKTSATGVTITGDKTELNASAADDADKTVILTATAQPSGEDGTVNDGTIAWSVESESGVVSLSDATTGAASSTVKATATGAGKATVKASIGEKSSTYDITVKSDITDLGSISADNVIAGDTVYAADRLEITFSAPDAKPAAEYRNTDSTVSWSAATIYKDANGSEVTGGTVPTINSETGVLTLCDMPDAAAKAEITVTAAAGSLTQTFAFVMERKPVTLTLNAQTFTYGDTDKVLDATVTDKDGNEVTTDTDIKYALADGSATDVATVSEDGKLTIQKVDTFSVTATRAADGKYAAASVTTDFTVSKKELTVKVANGTTIEKNSDSTTALTDDNKTAITNAVSFDGVVTGEIVTPNLGFDSAAYGTSDALKTAISGVTVSLSSTDAEKYTISGADVATGVYTFSTSTQTVPAQINANAVSESGWDLSTKNEWNITDTDTVTFTKGAADAKGTLWYNAETVEKIAITSGNAALYTYDADANQYIAYSFKANASTEETTTTPELYAVYQGVYYKIDTISYSYDATAPDLADLKVEVADRTGDTSGDIDFGQNKLTYTVTLSDKHSGINPKTVCYGVAADASGSPADWQTPDVTDNVNGTYTFSVTVSAKGYLCVKVSDYAGNESEPVNGLRPLVVEADKPEITRVTVDDTTGKNSHTLTAAAEDQPEDSYSGIWKINYTLYSVADDGTKTAVRSDAVVTNTAPAAVADLPKTASYNQLTISGEADGRYQVGFTATDFCGNISDEAFSEIFYLDTTPAEVKASMSGGTYVDGTYYYKADNHGITVTFTDESIRRGESGSYTVTVDGTTYTADPANLTDSHFSMSGNVLTFTLDTNELDKGAYEGDVSIAVSATDHAGNRTTEMAGSGVNSVSGLSASFVLDTIAPKVTSVTTNATPKHYADEANNYYYNDADVRTTVAIADTYPAAANWTTTGDAKSVTKEDKQLVFDLSDEKTYAAGSLSVSGTDKAGNKLVLASDAVYDEQLPGQDTASDDGKGTITLTAAKIVDRIAPVATVTYPKTANGTGNHYPNDTTNGEFGTIYYNSNPTVSVSVSDTYPLISGAIGADDTANGAQVILWNGTAEITAATKNAADTAVTADGHYQFTISGTDRAGNALVVIEQKDAAGTMADVTADGYAAEGSAYKTKMDIARDTVAPALTVAYNSPAQTHFYQESAGWTAYYNSDITATFSFRDANSLDETKLYYIQTKEGADGSAEKFGSAEAANNPEKTLTVAADADNHGTDGIYTYKLWGEDKAGNALTVTENDIAGSGKAGTASIGHNSGSPYITAPKAMDTVAPTVNITYTELDGSHFYENKYAYYNKAFTAAFAFEDTYGTDAKSYGLDEAKAHYVQELTDAKDQTLGSETANQNVTRSYDVAYRANVEGDHYSFTAYGEDKAGNALTVIEHATTAPNQYEENTGRSTKTSSAYEKVLDTLNPTVSLVYETDAAVKTLQTANNNRYYFNKSFTATFTVTETNFDDARITKQYGRNTGATNYQSDGVEANQTMNGSDKSYTYSDGTNGIYAFALYGTDRAGNPTVLAADKGNGAAYIDDNGTVHGYIVAVDTVAPKLTVTMDDFYAAVLSDTSNYNVTLNHPYRKQSSATVDLKSEDCSPLSIAYQMPSTVGGQSASADDGGTYTYMETKSVHFNAQQIYYIETLSVRDIAGNESRMGQKSNKIYLDTTAPTNDELAPTISVVANASASGRGPDGNPLFDGTVTVNAKITDPGSDVYASGLYEVYYEVTINDGDATSSVVVASSKGGTVKSTGVIGYGTSGSTYSDSASTVDEAVTAADSIDFTFNASDFNYNDVKIRVWAVDNSGNAIDKGNAAYYYFGIDTTAPKIEVSYDNNDAQNEKYFKADRTATVVVTERNFDPDNTNILTESAASIGGWSYAPGSMANGDDDTWTCQVLYSVDGDYTFDVNTKDLVHHDGGVPDYGASVAPKEFTIDKTKPVITISFDNNDVRNGKYYNAERTATILIEEHNFSADGAEVETTASIQEGSVAAPGVGGWSSGGDSNTARVPFTADGNYTMHVAYTDLAGNEAEPQDVEEFTVDTTAPELEISGVEDKLAYNGDVAPVITYHDINFDNTSAGVSITGYKHPDAENLTGTRAEDAMGGSFTCDNIQPLRENDDIYTAVGSVSDLAGNTTEARIVFSVNRFGSTYLLSTDTEALVDGYYTNTSPVVKVTEINVSPLTENHVTTSLNGELTNLKENTDYTVSASNPGWYQYDYILAASNFEKEGAYDVTLLSTDEAGNDSSNRAIKENEGTASELPINFVVDKTPPVNIITGVETGEQYIDTERTVVVNYDDNIGVASLTIYVNDTVAAEYDAEELKDAAGSIQYTAQASTRWQELRVVSVDPAGNTSDTEPVRFLLTDNLLVQYFNNKPLFYGSLLLLALIIFFIILLIKRRKDKEEEEKKKAVQTAPKQ